MLLVGGVKVKVPEDGFCGRCCSILIATRWGTLSPRSIRPSCSPT